MTLRQVYYFYRKKLFKKNQRSPRSSEIYQAVADDCGVHRRTVYRWFEGGMIPAQHQALLEIRTNGELKYR